MKIRNRGPVQDSQQPSHGNSEKRKQKKIEVRKITKEITQEDFPELKNLSLQIDIEGVTSPLGKGPFNQIAFLIPKREQLYRRTGTSLVVQWLRICLPMQGTRVQSLVWEDSTCCTQGN